MAWEFRAQLPDGSRFYARWDGTTLSAEPESVQQVARSLLREPLYATPTSAEARDPALRAALAVTAAALGWYGPSAWYGAEASWTGDVPWPTDDLPRGAAG